VWFSAETSFPEFATLKFNGSFLEVRRKLHFGKDLPIDVTDLLKAGENSLEIYLNVDFNDSLRSGYGIALECISSLSANDIKESVKRQSVDAAVVLESLKSSLNPIKKSLPGASGTTNDDSDDDIVLLSKNLTISIRDPITMSTIGPMPARGLNCKHHECFDLDTFLESRERSRLPDDPYKAFQLPTVKTTKPDVWKCPICRGDARPHRLQLDNWMLGVRNELEKTGRLDASKIVVEADGSWQVKSSESTSAPITDRKARMSTEDVTSSLKLPMQDSTRKRIASFQVILDSDDEMN
jgi:hypothetical protein